MPSVIKKLKQATDPAEFILAAEAALALSSPEELADCARWVANRDPGGWYYQAKFWGKVNRAISTRDNGDNVAALKQLAGKFNISSAQLRQWETRESILCAVEEDLRSELSEESKIYKERVLALRMLGDKIFNLAIKRKEDNVKYIKHALECMCGRTPMSAQQINNAWCKKHGNLRDNLDVVKPSDWWAFGNPLWDSKMPGAIPGEIYANALYYYAPQRGVAVDAMAGSGILKRVYDDRNTWQGNINFALDIHMYDLYPHNQNIKAHDAKKILPIKADWVFLDPPYFKQSGKFYRGFLAQTDDYGQYLAEMNKIISAMSQSLNTKGKLCIFCPKHRVVGADNPNIDVPGDLSARAQKMGLSWHDTVYVSRGRQQLKDAARRNLGAKKYRRPISDVCILNVFEK